VDVLSDAVLAMRTGSAHSARVRHPYSFGRRFPAVDAAGFHVVLQGNCWLVPERGEAVALGAGDVLFLPRGSAHGLAAAPDTPLLDHGVSLADLGAEDGPAGETVLLCGAYLLERSRSHPLLAELPEVVHLPARGGRHPGLRGAVDLLDAELDRQRPGVDAMVPALLDVLLLQVLRAWFAEQSHRPDGWAAALHDPGIAAALRAVHGGPERSWTVSDMGAAAGMSRSAFARRFTALVGMAPLAYLTWWRMTLAARLLRDSDAPLAAVAHRVGYRSEFSFAHAFKREFGVAPGGFRRKERVSVSASVAPGSSSSSP
jgi:AraC-like DNA-binding protein